MFHILQPFLKTYFTWNEKFPGTESRTFPQMWKSKKALHEFLPFFSELQLQSNKPLAWLWRSTYYSMKEARCNPTKPKKKKKKKNRQPQNQEPQSLYKCFLPAAIQVGRMRLIWKREILIERKFDQQRDCGSEDYYLPLWGILLCHLQNAGSKTF